MVVMTAPEIWADQGRALTVADMQHMPDDGFRYELDDGVLIVSPAPSNPHQLAVTRLAVILSAACPGGLEVLAGPGVNLSRFQHRVPDVAVVSAASVETVFQEQPPLLAVEVASPRTGPYDRKRKKDVYEQFGIQSCWIVDPDRDKPELVVFELRDRRYQEAARVVGDEVFQAVLPLRVEFAPSALVRVAR
jgi:Uma2 family endonuclease